MQKISIKREQSQAGLSFAEREKFRPQVKDSIKREQSQAGLSFAERKNRRSLAGGESNFRPQVKNKLLLLLALLMTTATGAWAQDAKHFITATYDKQTRSLEQPLPYATTVGVLYEAVTGEPFSDLISRMTALEMTLSGIGSTNTSVVSVGEFNGASTPVTVNADGKAAVALRFGSYAQGIFVSVTPPLYVTMADGTQDADKWTVKVGEGQAQALPIGGLKGDGSETVTLQYNGRLKVKGVKATSDAAPAAPATVDLDASTKAWADGSAFAVPAGGLTYSDAVTVSGNVTLTLTAGTTLTLNKGISLASGATLTIDGTGSMVVNGSNNSTASTVAGSTGTLVLTSGTLTAKGGNGASTPGGSDNNTGADGGVAINGAVTVAGGALTATGGNGGNAGEYADNNKGGAGAAAISGDVTMASGTIAATGGNGGNVGEYSDKNKGGAGGSAIAGNATLTGGTLTRTDGSNGSVGGHSSSYTVGAGGKAVAGTVTNNGGTVN